MVANTMVRRCFALMACFALVSAIGCSGMREAGDQITVHAESFRIFGFPIPEDDQAKANMLYADKAGEYPNVVTAGSTPADWTSFVGFFGNLFGFHGTVITARK